MLFRSIIFSKIIISTLILILSLNFLLDGFSSLSNNKSSIKNKTIKLQKNQTRDLNDVDVNKTLETYQEYETNENLKLSSIGSSFTDRQGPFATSKCLHRIIFKKKCMFIICY